MPMMSWTIPTTMQLPVIMIVATKSTGIFLSCPTTELSIDIKELKAPPMIKPIKAINPMKIHLFSGTKARFFKTMRKIVMSTNPATLTDERRYFLTMQEYMDPASPDPIIVEIEKAIGISP